MECVIFFPIPISKEINCTKLKNKEAVKLPKRYENSLTGLIWWWWRIDKNSFSIK
jgi:hypothetical protein